MTYTLAVVLGLCAAVLVDLLVLRTRLLLGLAFWATYPIIVIFQVISNGVFTGQGIVQYAPGAITGWRLAYAPVEDLGFGFSLVLTTLSAWSWVGRRESGGRHEGTR